MIVLELDVPVGDPQPGIEVETGYYLIGGEVVRDWGLHISTGPYFDENGPDPGDEVMLVVGDNHALYLIPESEIDQ